MKQIYLMLLLVFSTGIYAQSFEKTTNGIKATVNGNNVEIQFYSPSIVRVIKAPKAKPFVKESLSVILKPSKASFTTQEKNNVVTLTSKSVSVTLNLATGDVAFASPAGQSLLKEKPQATLFTPFNDAGNATYTVSQSFILDNDEPIYGLGQHQNGKLSQRGVNYRMEQGNVEDVVTFFQSVKGYGLYWDNYSPTDFKDSPNETVFKSDVGDGVDYYFISGGNGDGVITGMRKLTGKAPMFPLWTYGFWQSRERYKSQAELVDVVQKYRDLKVPLDGIIQDWQYWGNNYLWNAMDFLNPEFPDGKKMAKDVHDLNAHIIISIWSSFGPQTKQYREMDAKNMLYNINTWPESGLDTWPPNKEYPSGVRVYDVYNPEARDIYWKYANAGLFSAGIDGWWMDST